MRVLVAVAGFLLCSLAACPAPSPGDDAGPGAEGEGEGAAGEGEGEGEGGLPDAGPALEVDGNGCLTFNGAAKYCGGNSDDRVCQFSLGCGNSTSNDQCHINCEMGATVTCLDAAAIACVEAAVHGNDCASLPGCGFVL